MTKVRKQKKKKQFINNINRKRLRNRLTNVGSINCIPIKNAWNNRASARTNLKNMGLAYDPNEVLKIPSYKELQKQKALSIKNRSFTVTDELEVKPSRPTKTPVIHDLETEAKAPREYTLRLPKAQVDFITYLLDKYGDDYKAMARDDKNYYQETWKQLRAKIKKFMKNRKEFEKYMESRGLLDEDDNIEEIKDEAESLNSNNID